MYRYLLYNRTSTTGQEHNASRPHQFEAGKAFGDELGGLFVKEIYDNESGATLERSGIDEALRLLEEGRVDLIIAWDVSRTGRDTALLREFYRDIYRLGGKLALSSKRTVYKTIDEALIETHWERSAGEYERLQIERRTNNGKLVKLRLGGWINRVMYGYKLVTVRHEGVNLRLPEIVRSEAEIVNLALQLFVETGSTNVVLRHLNAEYPEGAGSARGWGLKVVRRFVQNAPLYAGKPFERSVVIGEATHRATFRYPAIISPELLAQVVAQNRTRTAPDADAVKPLRGLVHCSHCGRRATPRSNARSRRTGRMRWQFGCNSYMKMHSYKRAGMTVTGDICQGSIMSSTLVRAVLDGLGGYGNLEAQLQTGLADYEEALRLNRGVREGLEAQRREKLERKGRILERLLELGNVEDLYLLLERVKTEIGDINEKLSAVEIAIAEQEMVVESYASADRARGLGQEVGRLRELLEAENWAEANLLMARMGLKVLVDLSLTSRQERNASVRVVVDAGTIGINGTTSRESAENPYNLLRLIFPAYDALPRAA